MEVRYTDSDYSQILVVLPNGKVVESQLIKPSSPLLPNKKSLEEIKRMEAQDKKVRRDFQLILQSNSRGETAEDRIASLIDPDEVIPVEKKQAVNAGPRVQSLTRFNGLKLVSSQNKRKVTVEEIENTPLIEGMFDSGTREPVRIKEPWDE